MSANPRADLNWGQEKEQEPEPDHEIVYSGMEEMEPEIGEELDGTA